MKSWLAGLVVGVAVVITAIVVTDSVSIRWPWQQLPEFARTDVAVELPREARIVAVEPIALDCRARIHAEVPVTAERDHSAFGQVYRTDRVTMEALGDIDTCVEGTSAEVIHHLDGSTEVIIPGESIVFVRPRVDTVATANSVKVEKGLVGKLTDVFPWVSDDLGLTPTAYAFAQNVIGGSACTEAAYLVTEDLLIEAYRTQFVDQGADPDELTVRIDGEPIFSDPLPLVIGDDVTLSVADGSGVACMLSEDLGGGPAPIRR